MPDGFEIDWPVDVVKVTPHGAFLDVSPGAHADGHLGVDLGGPAGTLVKAPEGGVIDSVWKNDTTKPFTGYGPAGVLIKGDSGIWHLLGHLDPDAWSTSPWPDETGPAFKIFTPYPGDRIERGQVVGKMSNLRHTHYETRTKRMWKAPETHEDIVIDPVALVNSDLVVPAQYAPAAATERSYAWLVLVGLGILIVGRKRR